ncbi:MAG: phosphatidylserine decarboxylase [Leptospiraceae bacterium]|nr:phosphatidylserine decarboxylase [Leptospiraceae bacterium]MCP5512467.1 phosphatidylserine decarboxylase [Leptospiraceae bacterium]
MKIEYLVPIENEILSSYALLVLLVGLFVSFRLRFPQFRYFLLSLKILSGAMDDKGSRGQLIQSQAFFSSTASSLLLGAVLGSAFALSVGGVGVLFWIWVSAILVSPLKAVSSTLALKFRTKLPNGMYLSGPMYFIEKALKANWLAIAFALGSLGTVITLGGIVPVLSMTYISHNAFGSKGLIVPITAVSILIYVSVGGVRRLGKFSGALVPLSLTFLLISYYQLFSYDLIPFFEFIKIVFKNAFELNSMVAGGGLTLFSILGQSLGSFFITTETGVGKSAGIAGVVRTDYPFKQGLVSMLALIFESLVIATFTIYLLFSNNAVSIDDQIYFLNSLFGSGQWFMSALLMSSFIIMGMVSLSAWFYTGQQNAHYILGEKFTTFYRILFLFILIASSYLYLKKGDIVLVYSFHIGYTMAVITAIPILVSLALLAKMARLEMNKYFAESGASYEVVKDFYIVILTLLPKNLLSKLFGILTYAKLPRFIMIPILKAFAKIYKINVSEAELNITEYNSLNQFFTRSLKAGARIIDSAENAVVSPVDARITNFGDVNESTLIQAKGIDFSLKELIGSEKFYPAFENGKFITFYLSPQDYHRIHSPFYGRILGYYYEPGKLFPVNDMAVVGIKSLFPKNERLITFLQTEYGKVAVVKVGANNVGKIRVTYDNKIVTNSWIRFPKEYEYNNVNIYIDKGSELGRFEMGSTVILIFERNTIDLSPFQKEDRIHYGSTIGKFRQKLISLPK